MSVLSAPRGLTTRILFSALEPHPAPRSFAKGLADANRAKMAPYTVADARWWAEQTRDDSAPTDAEVREAFELRSLSTSEYRSLEAETRRYSSYDRWIDERAEDAEQLDRFEGLPALPPAPVHHILRASDGTALAVLLEGVDPANLAAVTSRAHRVLRECGPLKGVAWLARLGGTMAAMDRDVFADGLVFDGFTVMAARVIESAFGCRLPAAR
jgi:hypothetical protein